MVDMYSSIAVACAVSEHNVISTRELCRPHCWNVLANSRSIDHTTNAYLVLLCFVLVFFFVIGKRTVIRYRFIAKILRPTRGNTGKTHFVDSFDRSEVGQLTNKLGGTPPVKFHLQVTWILSSRTFMLSLTLFSSVERWENPWLSRSTLMTASVRNSF